MSNLNTLQRMLTFVDPFVGVMRNVELQAARYDDPRLFFATCEPSDFRALGLSSHGSYGSGCSYSHDGALISCVGEALERYSAATLDPNRFVFASAQDLEPIAVSPADLEMFSQEQYASSGFKYQRLSPDRRIRWVEAYGTDGDTTYVPVQVAFFSNEIDDEPNICIKTTSGLALHSSTKNAQFSALLELVERDAFMIAWHNCLTMPRIEHDRDEAASTLYRKYFEPTGLQTVALDLTRIAGIPTVLTYVVSDSDSGPRYSFGAASSTSLFAAWEKSMREAFHTRSWARQLLALDPKRAFSPDFSDVQNFEDHVRLYATADASLNPRFFADCGERVWLGADSTQPVVSTVDELVRILADQNISVYFTDVTSDDVRSAGLHVVRAIAPQLTPLDVDHRRRQLGKRRLTHRAYEAGLLERPLSIEELSPSPHPFP